MILKLVIITVATLVYYTYHFKEDVIDSEKEALIKRLRRKDGEEEFLKDDLKLKGNWHFFNWVKVAIFGILTGYLYNDISFASLYVICIIATMRIVYFNPLISIGLHKSFSWKNFFHLGEGKWEILFKGKEKLYYFVNLSILIICYCLIILEIY